MPLSPELKILDLIIEAANTVGHGEDPLGHDAFATFTAELNDLKAILTQHRPSCDECNAEKKEEVVVCQDSEDGRTTEVQIRKKTDGTFLVEDVRIQETEGEEKDWKEHVREKFIQMMVNQARPSEPERLRMHLLPEVGDLLSLAEAKGAEKERERIERIIRETMDGLGVQTNAEFIACDDLAIRILKAITPPTP